MNKFLLVEQIKSVPDVGTWNTSIGHFKVAERTEAIKLVERTISTLSGDNEIIIHEVLFGEFEPHKTVIMFRYSQFQDHIEMVKEVSGPWKDEVKIK